MRMWKQYRPLKKIMNVRKARRARKDKEVETINRKSVKKLIKNMIDFLIDFGRFWEPSWDAPKSDQIRYQEDIKKE